MDTIGIHTDQHSKVRHSDFQIAKAMCAYHHFKDDRVTLSQKISKILGRPVLVVNLADIPHAPLITSGAAAFTATQISERSAALQDMAHEALPDASHLWRDWKWGFIASSHEATSDFIRNGPIPPEKAMPERMAGPFWNKAGIIVMPDRRVMLQEAWPEALEDYYLGHEAGHVMQSCPAVESPHDAWRWESEIDSDRGSFNAMKIYSRHVSSSISDELHETIVSVKHDRARQGFLNAPPIYWSALSFDQADVTYERALLAGYELRLRVYADANTLQLPSSSEGIQKLITDWRQHRGPSGYQHPSHIRELDQLEHIFGSLYVDTWNFGWARVGCSDNAVDILQKVQGQSSDPLARRNAELIVAAHEYFKDDRNSPKRTNVAPLSNNPANLLEFTPAA